MQIFKNKYDLVILFWCMMPLNIVILKSSLEIILFIFLEILSNK